MKILVFGGRGFIGHNVVRRLAGVPRYEVVVADRPEADSMAASGCDAAVFAHGTRVENAQQAMEVHADLTARWLQSARPQRVVYLSSGECYGEGAVPFRETQALQGTSPYARAKIEGERRVLDYAERTGASWFVLRPAVVYGPGQSASTMLLPSVVAGLLAGERIELTEGLQTRDFVAVEDVAEAIARCLDDDVSSGTYNVGTGVETRVRDAATNAALCLSEYTNQDHLPQLLFGARPQPSHHIARYALDPEYAHRMLGWRSSIALGEGLRRMIEALLPQRGNRT